MKSLDVLDIPLSGTRLIEASAGTGKTFTIALLYLRLVMEQGLAADRILVVTYTRAAAAELRERIRTRLGEARIALERRLVTGQQELRGEYSKLHEIVDACMARGSAQAELESLKRALRGFDEAAIFTIHGFCERVLEENAFESGVAFGTELVKDQRALVDDVVADFWTRSLYGAAPEFVAWLRDSTRAGDSIGPGLLVGLAETVAGRPRIAVQPDQPPDRPGADLDEWRAALERVRQLFEMQGAEVLDRLAVAAEENVLKKNSFNPKKIRDSWSGEIENYLERPVIGATQPRGSNSAKNGVARLTRNAVEKGTRKGQTSPADSFFDAAQDLVDCDAQCATDFEARWLGLELELIAYTREELARRRRASRTRSFDELLTALADALDGEGGAALADGIRARFPAALVDEFQDTDPIQYAIFRRVWHDTPGPFFLIGDPKQAIYGFRGADVFAYMKAKTDGGTDAVGLDRNWRSDPSVIRGINALFERVDSPFLYEAIPFHPALPAPTAVDQLVAPGDTAGLRILFTPRREDGKMIGKGRAKLRVSAAVADEIAVLLGSEARIGDRALDASDIAVLCRTNAQALAMHEQLRRRGVASVMQTLQSVFDTDEASDLERLFKAAAEPLNVAAIRAAITTPLVGVDALALEQIDAEPMGFDPWLACADDWNARWAESGTLALVEYVLQVHGSRERLLASPFGERRLTNLFHLAELMQAAAHAGTVAPLAQIRWLSRMRRDSRARVEETGEDALIRLESDALAVQLVTIHRSKGLQYGVVYCPFLFDGSVLSSRDQTWVRFHDPEAEDRLTLDLGSDHHAESLEHARYEAFAENLRLLYVALTRAKHQVVIVWGAINRAESSALGCLLHPPPEFATHVANRAGSLVEACSKHIKSLDDEAMRADLDSLVRASDGAVSVESLQEDGIPLAAPSRTVDVVHSARVFGRRLVQRRRVASFSRLVAGVGPADERPRHFALPVSEDHPAAAGRDYDAAPELPGALRPPRDESAPPILLHAFPAGAGPGTMIHHVLEHLDFVDASPDRLESAALSGLARFGMPPVWAPTLALGLQAALDAPLGGPLGRFSLRELDLSSRIDELEFVLPVSLKGSLQLTPKRLAAAFEEHGASPAVRDYASRAAGLGFSPLAGYMRGFIDLVFRHAGRFYLADYKSNHLGRHASGYAPEKLADVMTQHDYTLQYHLYALALHRFLHARIPDYSYEQDFGGVYYLFIRGMSPRFDSGSGIFHDRPSEALLSALSTALDGAEADALTRGEG